MWSGAIGNIPDGWVLCDGNNGTPDLRDKFVPGAGNSYNPADAGGAAAHIHDFTADGHTHTVIDGDDYDDGLGDFIPDTDSENLTGFTNPTNILTPFYSLAYIMAV